MDASLAELFRSRRHVVTRHRQAEVLEPLLRGLCRAIARNEVDKVCAEAQCGYRHPRIDLRDGSAEDFLIELLGRSLIAHIQHDMVKAHRDERHETPPLVDGRYGRRPEGYLDRATRQTRR